MGIIDRIASLSGYRRHGAIDNSLKSLLSLAWVVEARDPYTGGHLWRVSQYARLVAGYLGLSRTEVSRAALGGFLHDLGKIGIPDRVLLKTSKLDDDEYDTIRTHPETGRRLVAQHPLGAIVMDAVHLHHERPDGRGYPLGLKGSAIPQMAAIIGVCDAFDAMTSSRPYRSPMPLDRALDIVREQRGLQFDERASDALLALGNTASLEHIAGHSDDGIPLRRCLSCGPIVVTTRSHRDGMPLFCPACGSGYETRAETFELIPSGQVASPADRAPAPDTGLIEQFAKRLSLSI